MEDLYVTYYGKTACSIIRMVFSEVAEKAGVAGSGERGAQDAWVDLTVTATFDLMIANYVTSISRPRLPRASGLLRVEVCR
jgi:hypothetical protein